MGGLYDAATLHALVVLRLLKVIAFMHVKFDGQEDEQRKEMGDFVAALMQNGNDKRVAQMKPEYPRQLENSATGTIAELNEDRCAEFSVTRLSNDISGQ